MTTDMSHVENVPAERASESIPNTRRWARDLHHTQTEKNGLPYVTHLDEVAFNVVNIAGWDEPLVQAAYLHDVIEDTPATAKMIEDEGFDERTVYAVNVVTKRSGEPNYDYTTRVIKAGPDPMIVKLADLYHNTAPERLSKLQEYTQKRLREKYLSAIYRIENALYNLGYLSVEQRTVTFEDALKAVTVPVSSYNHQWWKRTLNSIWPGDLIKFPDSPEPEREWVVISKRVKTNGAYAFTLEGWDGDIVLSPTSTYLSKFKATATAPTTTAKPYHDIWKKRLGLPATWKVGDPVPQYLEGEKPPQKESASV